LNDKADAERHASKIALDKKELATLGRLKAAREAAAKDPENP